MKINEANQATSKTSSNYMFRRCNQSEVTDDDDTLNKSSSQSEEWASTSQSGNFETPPNYVMEGSVNSFQAQRLEDAINQR